VSLLTELDAFFTDHRRCGDLDTASTGPSCGSPARAEPAWRGGRTRATQLPPTIDSLYCPGMDRRGFLLISLSGVLAAPLAAGGQQPGKVHRIGVIVQGGPRLPGPAVAAFDLLIREMTEQLRASGWVEGQNITLEYRLDEGKRERLPTLAADLVDLKVSVIVAVGTPAALAAKGATATIPIVMVNVGDPLRSGLAASLARPGGNVTGMAFMGPEVTFKQLELVKEVLPLAGALGVLFDPLNRGQVDNLADVIPEAAAATRLKIHPIKVPASSPLDAAFTEVTRKRIDGLVVFPLDRPPGWARDVAALATKHRLPTIGPFRWQAEQGMLMSFAPRAEEQYQRAGVYIDRILRGASASALPIEQPTRFQLVINMKTAKALGLTIPPSLLARADQVIE
jgi:ABC-type uncharacterized transport system substrate-binding protein